MKFSTATLVTILLELTTVDPMDAAASSVSSIRGVTSTQQHDDKAWSTTHFGTTRTHRHLGQDNADCLLVERSTLVEHDTEFEDHQEREGLSRAWVCEFPFSVAQSELRGHVFIDIDMDDVPMAMIDSMGAQSGASILRTTGAYVEELLDPNTMAHMWTMHVPPTASMEVVSIDSEHGSQHSRRLASFGSASYSNTRIHTGILSVLVVKVIDSAGASINAKNEHLSNDFFGNEYSLKTGMESCSKEQLIIEPAADRDRNDGERGIVNGITSVVVAVTQETTGAGPSPLEEGAISNLEAEYGDISSDYDLVILCMPHWDTSVLAYAYINSWLSVYKDNNCQDYGVQMHEIGHNLGFAHSNQGRVEYGDNSGFMGDSDGDKKMCFNAPKSFQSGWYTNAQESFSPFDNQNSMVERTLIGIDDYQVSGDNNGNLVTLRLGVDENENGASSYCYNGLDGLKPDWSCTSPYCHNRNDYYVGFNLKEGINEGTAEGGNQVLIFHKQFGGPTKYGQSDRIAYLNQGDSYTIQDFKGTSIDVTITVKSFGNNGRTAPIEITTGEDTDVITCFNAPKNFQSGLYTYAQDSFYPFENRNSMVERFTLMGIDDYQDYQVSGDNNGNLITLRLGADQNDASTNCYNRDDYYVGFNLKEVINEGTGEGDNQVLIFHKQAGGPTQFGHSVRIADLNPDESYTIQGFKGSSIDVTISVKAFGNNGRTAHIEITTENYNDLEMCSNAPSNAPTDAPTEKPCTFTQDCRKARAGKCFYKKDDGKPGKFLPNNDQCPNGKCFCKKMRLKNK